MAVAQRNIECSAQDMRIVFNAAFMSDCSAALSNLVFFEVEGQDGEVITSQTSVSTEL